MKNLKTFLFISFIVFSCTSGSSSHDNELEVEAEAEELDISSLGVEDVLGEVLAIDELVVLEELEELKEMDISIDELTEKSVEVKVEEEKDKSPELKVEEKKIEVQKKEAIKDMVKESPLKGKNCDEILKIFEGVTSGSTVVDYDIMNDPFFVICKSKGALEEEFAKVEDDDVDEEPW